MHFSSEKQFLKFMKNSTSISLNSSKGRVRCTPVVCDGINFASKRELEIYLELKYHPLVEILECHPEFILQEKFKRNGRTIRAIKYTADFFIMEDGRKIVVEVKSEGTLKANSKSYPIRRKLFLKKFPEFGFREIVFMKNDRIVNDY